MVPPHISNERLALIATLGMVKEPPCTRDEEWMIASELVERRAAELQQPDGVIHKGQPVLHLWFEWNEPEPGVSRRYDLIVLAKMVLTRAWAFENQHAVLNALKAVACADVVDPVRCMREILQALFPTRVFQILRGPAPRDPNNLTLN